MMLKTTTVTITTMKINNNENNNESNNNDDNNGLNYITFGPKFHMEQHYNSFYLSFKSKNIGRLLGISYTKTINGSFHNTALIFTLRYHQKKLRSKCGNSTYFKKQFKS